MFLAIMTRRTRRGHGRVIVEALGPRHSDIGCDLRVATHAICGPHERRIVNEAIFRVRDGICGAFARMAGNTRGRVLRSSS